MQPDVNSDNSEELVKSTGETLTLTLNKQYQGKNGTDIDDFKKGFKKAVKRIIVLKCCNVIAPEM